MFTKLYSLQMDLKVFKPTSALHSVFPFNTLHTGHYCLHRMVGAGWLVNTARSEVAKYGCGWNDHLPAMQEICRRLSWLTNGISIRAEGLPEKVTAAHLKGNVEMILARCSQLVVAPAFVYHSYVRNGSTMNASLLESVLSVPFWVVSLSSLSSGTHLQAAAVGYVNIFSIICITVWILLLQSTDFFSRESACWVFWQHILATET